MVGSDRPPVPRATRLSGRDRLDRRRADDHRWRDVAASERSARARAAGSGDCGRPGGAGGAGPGHDGRAQRIQPQSAPGRDEFEAVMARLFKLGGLLLLAVALTWGQPVQAKAMRGLRKTEALKKGPGAGKIAPETVQRMLA